MEERVKIILKLIEEDGDSFARRAEMYYKKRPELINFVEESYRAYRALAERYNHLSTELQNANNTIASIFPEQFQFAMENEDDSGSPKSTKKSWEISKGGYMPCLLENSKGSHMPYVIENSKAFVSHVVENPKGDVPTVHKGPKPSVGDVKGLAASGVKRKQQKIISPNGSIRWIPKSGLSIPEGLDEIHRLQKWILKLQTEKEFARSTHECAMVKYWELDNEIQEIHDQLCSLEDEFGEGQAIADDEARIVMEVTALKSCRDTLAQLEDKQVRYFKEAQVEKKRIVVSRKKLDALKKKLQLNQEEFKRSEQETGDNDDVQKRKEIESLREKIKQQFELFFSGSLSVTEMAEKIDELVNNVINLKSAVASQSLLVVRLRTEIDMLLSQIEVLEDVKDTLIDGKIDVKKKIREMEEKLNEIQELSHSFEVQNKSLQTHFTEAHCSLDHLSEKVLSIKEKFEKEHSSSMAVESSTEKAIKGGEKKLKMVKTSMELKDNSPANVESKKVYAEEENSNGSKDLQAAKPGIVMESTSLPKESQETGEKLDHNVSVTNCSDAKLEGNDNDSLDMIEHESIATSTNGGDISHENSKPSKKREDLKAASNVEAGAFLRGANNIDKLGLTELETKDKEKDLLMEYSIMLRNKDTEKKLKEAKANNQDGKPEIMVQLKELNKSNAIKDELIRSLQEKLSLLQTGLGENNNADQNVEPKTMISEKIVIIETQDPEKQVKEDFDSMIDIEKFGTTSEIENKFRADIDELLEENLDFWCRFSSTFQEVNMFRTRVKDLSEEVSKIEAKRKQDRSISSEDSVQSEVKLLSEHLRQVHDELTVWTEKGESLREELKQRFSSLCELQEEITMALKASAEDDEFTFTSDQAARFQGEIQNMKQENIRVANELEAGLDNVARLQLEIRRNLAKLSGDGGLSGSYKCRSGGRVRRSDSDSGKVPLSAFIFGGKSKKQKSSILRRMNTRMTTVLLRSVHSSKF
ncbi:Detected protein of unknown function [Hibiscus syriacus]|uniref:NAB domain-containing protein n=2 Tax=Hibiscus syriacus TaxID=106335 RepID=A0A6A2ZXP0_HIBSY|nr:Detected protein of unknown function [Hibiscus syriacus]